MTADGWLTPPPVSWRAAPEALHRAVLQRFGRSGDEPVEPPLAARVQQLEWEGRAPEASLAAARLLEHGGGERDGLQRELLHVTLALNLLLRGRMLEAFAWAERGMAERRGESAKAEGGACLLAPLAGAVRALIGSPDDGRHWLAEAASALYDEGCPPPRRLWMLTCLLLCQLRSVPSAAELEALVGRWGGLRGVPSGLLLRPAPVLIAWARLRMGGDASALRADLARIERIAGVPSLDCHRQALHAHAALREGRMDVAMRRALRAEELSHAVDNRWTLLEAHVVRAQVHGQRGWHRAARRDADLAVTLAVECGWSAYARLLAERLPVSAAPSSPRGPRETAERPGPLDTATPLERLHRQLDALLRASAAWISLTDVEQLLRRMLDEAVMLLGAERALLFLADPNPMVPAAGRDGAGCDLPQAAAFSRTAVERAMTEGEVVLVCSADGGEGWDSLAAHELRSVIASPLRLGERVLGVLYADTRVAPRGFGADDVPVVRALAGHMALGLEQARAARLASELFETRQRFLAAQIRPHFLFNALNSIAALVAVDAVRAERLIVSLSRFLRQSFAQQTATSTIDDELRYLQAYLDIEQARYGQRLRVTIEVDDDVRSVRIPSMSVQPLVENAVRHGVTARPQGGTVRVWARRDARGVEIGVEDDGVGFVPGQTRPASTEAERSGTGVGLGNVRDRVQGLLGSDADFQVSSRVGEGTRVTFRVTA